MVGWLPAVLGGEEAKKPHRPIERLVQLGIAKDVTGKSAA